MDDRALASSTTPKNPPYANLRVADRAVDLTAGEIERGGEVLRISPKVAATLEVLCERPGEVISKEEILERVWPDAHVTDDGLWHSIAELRRIFDDDPKRPRIIETLPKRGYRLIAPVESSAETSPADAAPEPPLEAAPGPRATDFPAARTVGALALLALVAFSAWAVLSRPDNPETSGTTLLERGLAAFEEYTPGHNERAIELLEAAVDDQPTNARARAALADAYSFKAIYHSTEPWWRARALAEARRAVELDPELPEAYKAIGLAQVANRDREAALDAYRQALAMRPTYHQVANNLALLESSLGRVAEAARLFEQALGVVPDDPDYRANLATALRLLGLPERAEAELEIATKDASTPDDAEILSAIAWQRTLLDLARGAREAGRLRLEAALDANPRSRALRTHVAEVALHLGRPERASTALEQLIAPWDTPSDVRTAALLRAADDDDLGERPAELAREALAATDEVTARRSPGRSMERATAYLLLGERSEAIDWLEALVDAGYRDRFCLGADPVFVPLHDEPRFRALLARLDVLVAAERERFLARD